MGTHISRGTVHVPFVGLYIDHRAPFLVKSVDLDIWTPDQIEVCLLVSLLSWTMAEFCSTECQEMGESASEYLLGSALESRTRSTRPVCYLRICGFADVSSAEPALIWSRPSLAKSSPLSARNTNLGDGQCGLLPPRTLPFWTAIVRETALPTSRRHPLRSDLLLLLRRLHAQLPVLHPLNRLVWVILSFPHPVVRLRHPQHRPQSPRRKRPLSIFWVIWVTLPALSRLPRQLRRKMGHLQLFREIDRQLLSTLR